MSYKKYNGQHIRNIAMTPSELKKTRKRVGLTQSRLAATLRLGRDGIRTVQRWETGAVDMTGPATVAVELMVNAITAEPTEAARECERIADALRKTDY